MANVKKRIGVVLSGCGNQDGSEIHEATLTLLAIDRVGAEAVCFAPKGAHAKIRNHLTAKDVSENRDMLVESARIARGKISDLMTAKASELDAVIIPGGTGAGANLSNFFAEGVSCRVRPDLMNLIRDIHAAKKPIGAICIAPATLAKALQDIGVKATITIGTDDQVAAKIESMGHRHERSPAINCVIDRQNKIVTTPAYMNAKSIGEVWQGVEKLVGALIEMS